MKSRSASRILPAGIVAGLLVGLLPSVAVAAPDPVAVASLSGVVPTSGSTTISGLSVTDSTTSDVLQVTVSTDLGTLTVPTTTGLTVSSGDSFTADANISFAGTVPTVNAALASVKLNTGTTAGTAHVSLSAMTTTAGTAYDPVNGHYYQLVTGSTSWTAAKAAAAAKPTFHGLNGYLATPATDQVNTFLANTFPTADLWIGGQSTDTSGLAIQRTWNWVTGPYNGTPFTTCTNLVLACVHGSNDAASYYYSWDTGQPDGTAVGLLQEDYTATNHAGDNGKWNDEFNNPGGMGGYLVEYGNAKTSTTYPTSPPSTATGSVTVADKPAAPSAVVITAGNASATATFTPPANPTGAPVTGYTITATPHAGGTAITGTCTGSPCTLNGLTNGTSYDVTVRANNAAGTGTESAVTTLTPAGTPGVPTGVAATAGDGQASVAFTAPTANNGATIASYTVTATPPSGTAVTKTCTGSPCVVTGLTNGTAYSVTVHATSTLGASSAESTPVSVTPAGTPTTGPTGVVATAGDQSATLTFTPVTSVPPVSGYTATVTPQSGTATTKPCSGSGCVITGLTNGTQYTITLHATNSAGNGPESSPVTVTPAGRPGAPSVSNLTGDDGKATVTFTAPGNTNGAPITGYTVTAAPSGGGVAVTKTCTASPCTVTGLTNGTAYTVTVHATTSGGDSVEAAAGTVTPAGAPGVPTGVTAVAGDARVTVSYTAPANTNGAPITGYTVTATPSGGGTAITSTCGASSISCAVTGLTNGTAYVVTVHATTSGGSSAEASAGTLTPATVPAAPTNVVAQRADGGATITFTAPADPATAAVTGYTVTAIPASGASTTSNCSAGPCSVTGLTVGTSYTFTVQATNRIGSSPASNPSNAVTVAKVPSAPQVTAAPKDGQAILTITAGAANGDPITGYTVTRSPAPSGGATTSCGTSGTCVVNGLTNGQAYVFSVTAQNGIGSSAATTAGAIPQHVPTAPTGRSATAGDGSITVFFDPASSTDPAAATGYEYSTDNGATWHPLTVDTSGPKYTGTVAGLTDGQAYAVQVRGTSTYGTGPAATFPSATPVAAPGAPTNIAVQPIDGGASVSFTAPTTSAASPVTGYTVSAYPAGGGTPVTAACTSSPCSITGLTVGTSYTFTVAATNGTGSTESVRSSALTVAAKPDAPTGVTADPKDGNAVVSFTAPAANGSPITSYTITSSPATGPTVCTTTSCTVSGLTDGTSYTFSVTATNSLGTSAASSPSSAVTPQPVPAALTGGRAKPGDGSVTVSFTTPTSGTVPTGYEYSFDGTTWTTAAGVVDTNGTSAFTVSGLTNGTPVHVYLRGVSTYGTSPTADLGSVTPALPPGAPSVPTATRKPNGDVQISFTPPANDGGSAITGYEYTTDGGLTWHTLTTTGTSPLSGTITGLTNGTTYQIATRAVTPAGTSVASPIVTVVAASAPGAPTVVSVTPKDGIVVVAFNAPASNGGDPISSYTVTASPGGATATCTTSPCAVAGLTNDTAYTFTVTATNGVGTSTGSTPSSSVKPEAVPAALADAAATAGDGKATITFTTPSSSDPSSPTSYEYSVDGGAWQAASGVTTSGSTTSFDVSPLTDGTTVHLDVRGVSSYGNGVRTNLGTVTPSAPPAAGVPGSPTAVRQPNGDVKLTFAAPTGTAPTGYEYDLGDGTGWHTLTTTGTSPVTGTIDHSVLTEGATYSIRVRADHAPGTPSDPSTAVTVHAAAAPDAPANVAATPRAESVELSFTAPDAHGSPILGYDYSTDGGTTWHPLTYVVSGSTVTGTVPGLTDGASYSFTVRANNTVGSSAGTASTPASVTPKAGPSAPAPSSVTVTPVSGGATVSFTPPTGDATTSAPTGYEYSTDGGVTWCTLVSSGTSPLTGSIDGLANGTTYAVSLRGTSSYGNGTATSPVSVTPVGAPSAPAAPVVSLSGTTATVSWTPGNDGGAGMVTYTVTSSSGGYACTTTGTSCSISGLTPGSSYTFAVTPTNQLGTGAVSSPSNRVTVSAPSSGTPTPTPTPTVAGWYADPVSAAVRAKEVKVPRAAKRYHGKKKATLATYRAANGQVLVPITTPRGRALYAGQGVQIAMKSLFKGSSITLTKRGKAQLKTLATSLHSASAITCEGYTDYTLAHGKKLSSKRAAAVCKTLVADGVRVAASSRGYGGKRPVVLANKAGARQANNRLVVLVTR